MHRRKEWKKPEQSSHGSEALASQPKSWGLCWSVLQQWTLLWPQLLGMKKNKTQFSIGLVHMNSSLKSQWKQTTCWLPFAPVREQQIDSNYIIRILSSHYQLWTTKHLRPYIYIHGLVKLLCCLPVYYIKVWANFKLLLVETRGTNKRRWFPFHTVSGLCFFFLGPRDRFWRSYCNEEEVIEQSFCYHPWFFSFIPWRVLFSLCIRNPRFLHLNVFIVIVFTLAILHTGFAALLHGFS